MIVSYECTKCDETTSVQEWPATRINPAESTWADGCEHCGAELEQEPVDDYDPDAERDYEMELDR